MPDTPHNPVSIIGEDRQQLGLADFPVRVDPTGTTVQPVSGTVAVVGPIEIGTVDQGDAGALAGAWPVKVTDGTNVQPTGDSSARSIHTTVDNASVPVTGPLTDAEMRATAVPVDGSGVTQPVSGTFWQATQPVSNPGTFAVQAAQSGTWTVTGAAGTFPVTGTFWQATQPVSGPVTDAELRAASLEVTETNPAVQYAEGEEVTLIEGGAVLGAVSDAPSSLLPGLMAALSLTTEGSLRVSSTASVSAVDFWGDPFEQVLTDEDVDFYGDFVARRVA